MAIQATAQMAADKETVGLSRKPHEARRTFPIHPDIDPPVVAASASSSGEENAEKLLLRLKNEKFETAEPADNVYEDESLVNKEMAELMFPEEVNSINVMINSSTIMGEHDIPDVPEKEIESPSMRIEKAATSCVDESKEAKYKLASTAFDKEYLKNFQTGFNTLFSIWMTICESKNRPSRVMPGNVLERMNKMMTENWTKVEEKYINDPFQAYLSGSVQAESVLPAELILQLIARMDVIEKGLMRKLKEYDKATNVTIDSLQEKVDVMSEGKKELSIRIQKRNMEITQANSECVGLRAAIEVLERRVQFKSIEIEQLRKGGTVQLWEKEKKKLMETSLQREEEMRVRIIELEEEAVNYVARIKRLDEKFRVQKMKNELRAASDMDEDTERDKKYIFMLEQDVHRLNMELRHQQRHVAGILMGLKKDLGSAIVAFHQKGNLGHDVIDTVLVPQGFVSMAYEASKLGKLSVLRADLPLHYLASAEECKTMCDVHVKLLSTAYAKKLPESTPSSIPMTSRSSRRNGRRTSETECKKVNPTLSNPVTGSVEVDEVKKYFPELTDANIRDQFDHFKGYDKDNSGTLDLGKAMAAMSSTTGDQFTATQIKEALTEVAQDATGSIDFYDYLSMARMVLNQDGRAQLFRSKLVEQEGKQVSKVCLIM